MPKTSAQRQAAYRQRRDHGDGERRLNTWISASAHLALQRIARHHGITRRALLERLVLTADNDIVAALELDTPAWDHYFGVMP